MACPHRAVVEARVMPESEEERELAMGVACAVARATRAQTAIYNLRGELRAWVSIGAWCPECGDDQ